MVYSEEKKKYNIEYAKRAMKRVPLDMKKTDYEILAAAAAAAGEPVNTYIKNAIAARIQAESAGPDPVKDTEKDQE